MTEKDVNNFANNVIKLIRDDLGRFDDSTEKVIKNSIIYEMRHWTYVTPRNPSKREKKVEVKKPAKSQSINDNTRKAVYQMLDDGKKSTEIQKELSISGLSVINYKRDWHSARAKAEVKSRAWYEQEFPNLTPAMYDALASGQIKDTIIRRNRW